MLSCYSNGSIRVDYDVLFNSTASNLTTASLNRELEKVINNTNGTIGNSLVLGAVEKGRLFVVEGTLIAFINAKCFGKKSII